MAKSKVKKQLIPPAIRIAMIEAIVYHKQQKEQYTDRLHYVHLGAHVAFETLLEKDRNGDFAK